MPMANKPTGAENEVIESLSDIASLFRLAALWRLMPNDVAPPGPASEPWRRIILVITPIRPTMHSAYELYREQATTSYRDSMVPIIALDDTFIADDFAAALAIEASPHAQHERAQRQANHHP